MPVAESAFSSSVMTGKPGTRFDAASQMRASQVPSLLQLRDIAFPSSSVNLQTAVRPATPPTTPPSQSPITSRSSSPYSRRPSPPRGTNTFSKNVIDSLRKSNELLKQEVSKLQNQVKNMKQKCHTQDMEVQKLRKNAQEYASYAVKESSKFKEAKEVVKSITDQLKEVIEKLSSEVSESETIKSMNARAEVFLNTHGKSEASLPEHMESSNMMATILSNDSGETSTSRGEGEKEINEQFEPGVYITYAKHQNGGKIFRRVRFSKRKFDGHQAEEWWGKNKDRVLMRYSPNATRPSSAASSPTRPPPSTVDETTEATPPSET